MLQRVVRAPMMGRSRREKVTTHDVCPTKRKWATLAAHVALKLATLLYNHAYHPDANQIKSLLEYALASHALTASHPAAPQPLRSAE